MNLDINTNISIWNQNKSKLYWDQYYTTHKANTKPSRFAEFCLNILPSKSTVLELGCGNGRDSKFFANNGHNVIVCEQSNVAVKDLNSHENIEIITSDFTRLDGKLSNRKITAIYSRFSLHSIDANSASKVLQWCVNNLCLGGALLIEVRSIFDELYGQGKSAGKDAFVVDHYRRFIRQDDLNKELENIGFQIDLSVASKGFAPYQAEDPVVIRVVAKKPTEIH